MPLQIQPGRAVRPIRPLLAWHESSIFLCPERIHGIYPAVISLGEHLRHPLRLSSNPALVSLQMTLLHELGHHFFPVHRSGAGRFFSEALANLFCPHGLGPDEQAWLLYKSWHLQPPEDSAYRPLRVLCEADSDCRFAVAVNPGAVTRPGLRAALDRALAVATNDQAMWFDRVPAIRLIEACRDTSAIPALENAFAASKEAWGGGRDVHEAAAKALTARRTSLGSGSIVEEIGGSGTG